MDMVPPHGRAQIGKEDTTLSSFVRARPSSNGTSTMIRKRTAFDVAFQDPEVEAPEAILPPTSRSSCCCAPASTARRRRARHGRSQVPRLPVRAHENHQSSGDNTPRGEYSTRRPGRGRPIGGLTATACRPGTEEQRAPRLNVAPGSRAHRRAVWASLGRKRSPDNEKRHRPVEGLSRWSASFQALRSGRLLGLPEDLVRFGYFPECGGLK
jgi:hypothetical protein